MRKRLKADNNEIDQELTMMNAFDKTIMNANYKDSEYPNEKSSTIKKNSLDVGIHRTGYKNPTYQVDNNDDE